MKWLKSLKGKIRFNEPLKKHTSFKIGGKSHIWFEPKDVADLINCLSAIKKNKIPYFLIGNGTNLLIKDAGFKGIFIKLNSPSFRRISVKKDILTVGAGLSIRELINYLTKFDFGGFEFLAGIPGTIGGALVMNAGTTDDKKRYKIGDIVHKVRVLDNKGRISDLLRKDVSFNYRDSNLNRYIILEAQLKLMIGKRTDAKNKVRNFLLTRKKKQDYSKPNAGCVFKNPSLDLRAGTLIERCGFKGVQYGGAKVSNKHANFILNFDGATANDVIKLIKAVKRKVKDNFGIQLKEEVRVV